MMSKMLLMLLSLMLMVPHSSASSISSSSGLLLPWLKSSVKIFIFDLGLFLYDVFSDIYNGKTFIDDGHPIWGAVILGVIFIPITLFYVSFAIEKYRKEDSSQRKKLLILLFAPILAAPAIPIMTVAYIVYVAYFFARKCFQPGYNDDVDDGANISWAGWLKLFEAVGEANLQAVLVTYVTLVTGLSSSSTFSQFMQIGGILASFFSVAKTCCEHHLKWLDEDKKDPNFTTTMKGLLFFAPHVLWRTTATAFVVAFLKFYSLVPLVVHILICSGITIFLHKSYGRQLEFSFASFALSLFTPSVFWAANHKFDQSLLKATMLTSSLILLPSLIFIRLLPSLPPDTVLCTLGLSHLDLGSTIPSCSPCFNATAVSTGAPCVMVTSMDDFSNYFFIPFIILGIWCLFEEATFLCKRCKRWPLPYRMIPSIKEDAEQENRQVEQSMLDKSLDTSKF